MSNVRIVSKESILQDKRQRGHTVPHATLQEPIARLITTQQGLAAVRQKITLDVNEGREDIPLLYLAIYSALKSDTLPKNVDTNVISEAQAVFLRRFEGEEVKFGTLTKGTPGVVPIENWSSGFEWTREMQKWNEEYRLELYNQAFGRAYNALLNHLHLSPILTFAYAAANRTAADATAGATLLDRTRTTLVNALRDSSKAKRKGSVLLASSQDEYQITDALARRRDVVGNELPGITIDTIIFYDGETLSVGEKDFAYAGVAAKRAYLIRPKRQFYELVATEGGQDLIVETGNPDVSRGILDQVVAHTYRGVYAAVPGNVQEITLP